MLFNHAMHADCAFPVYVAHVDLAFIAKGKTTRLRGMFAPKRMAGTASQIRRHGGILKPRTHRKPELHVRRSLGTGPLRRAKKAPKGGPTATERSGVDFDITASEMRGWPESRGRSEHRGLPACGSVRGFFCAPPLIFTARRAVLCLFFGNFT